MVEIEIVCVDKYSKCDVSINNKLLLFFLRLRIDTDYSSSRAANCFKIFFLRYKKLLYLLFISIDINVTFYIIIFNYSNIFHNIFKLINVWERVIYMWVLRTFKKIYQLCWFAFRQVSAVSMLGFNSNI